MSERANRDRSSGVARLGVVTAVRNAAEALEATLRSVQEQSHPAIEHVVVDGGSTDGTREVIARHADRLGAWVSEPDRGVYDAMNKGMALLSPEVEYVNFLNAGDRFDAPDTVARVFAAVDPRRDDIVYGDVLVEPPAGPAVHRAADQFSMENLLRRNTAVLCHQAMLVHRRILRPYDTRYRYKAELDWYFALLEQTPAPRSRYVAQVLVRYPTGGLSERHFLEDRLEGLAVVWRRYGPAPFLRYPVLRRFLVELARYYRLKPRMRGWLRLG